MPSIEDLVIPGIDVPRGRVKVELFDERGRCKQREEAENFISIYAIALMKWAQRYQWGQYFPGTKNLDAFGRDIWSLPSPPTSYIACWSDASAEDPATERVVKGQIVAAASRFPQGSPTGGRGIINTSETVGTPDSLTFVWDWLTSTGNGTFQSVGFMNCTAPDLGAGLPCLPIGSFPDPFYGAIPLSVNISTPTTYYRGGLWHDGTNWLVLHTVGQTNAISGYAIYAVDPTTGVGTLQVTLPTTTFRYATSLSNTNPNAIDLCKIGTDYYVIGPSNAGAGATYVDRYNASGTLVTSVLHDGGTNEMPAAGIFGWGITTDGTDLFVASSNGKIYKLSPTTLLVTATLTPSFSTTGLMGIAYDGTNLRVMTVTGVVFSVDKTTGALITTDPTVFLGSTQENGTATAPFSGLWFGANGAMNMAQLTIINVQAGSNAMDDTLRAASWGLHPGASAPTMIGSYPSSGGLHYRSGKLYWNSGLTLPNLTPTRITEITYSALGSRVKLASPIVKDSSKTMKITYTLAFA